MGCALKNCEVLHMRVFDYVQVIKLTLVAKQALKMVDL